MKLLEVPEAIVEQAVSQMLTSGSLMLEEIEGEPLIFLPHLRRAEEGIAARIKRLAGTETVYPPIDFEKAVTWCEQRTGKMLAPSQREALKTVFTKRAVVITGGPGVGKTTLVNSILMILRAKGVKCLLCAPTGRAAKRLTETTSLEAKTIHRLLEIDPGTGRFSRNESNPLACDLLVMDETSMVDVLLMHSLLRALPKHAGLILVGDVDQLPSVGPGTVLHDLIDSGVVPVVRLTEVFRQATGSQIITNAHRIRCGQMPDVRGAQIHQALTATCRSISSRSNNWRAICFRTRPWTRKSHPASNATSRPTKVGRFLLRWRPCTRRIELTRRVRCGWDLPSDVQRATTTNLTRSPKRTYYSLSPLSSGTQPKILLTATFRTRRPQ